MLKNAVIVIPNVSDEEQVCDFLAQTAIILRQNNFVYVKNYFNLPKILPFGRFAFINHLNRFIYFIFFQFYLLIKHRQAKGFYWWIFFPQLSLISKIKAPGWKLVFDIVDYHFSPIKTEQEKIEKQKDELLVRADYIFSISETLKNLYQLRASKEIKVVPQGFAKQELTAGLVNKLKFPDDKPIIGFVGQISERLDFNLINELVSANQNWNFVFVGPLHYEPNVATKVDKNKLEKIISSQNVFYFQGQKRQELLDLVNRFDICMIPYDVNYDFNRFCYPMKLFEYFYAGKPVVSTEIEELKRFEGLVFIGSNAKFWQKHISFLLQKKWSVAQKNQQRRLANLNSWENKLEKISEHLLQNEI